MVGRGWLIAAILFLLACPLQAAMQEGSADAPAQEAKEKTFSPLHDFLGIDPDTGKFVEPEKRAARETEADPSPTSTAADDATDDRGGESRRRGTASGDDLPRNAEEAAEAVRRVTERLNEESLGDFASLLDQRLSGDGLGRLSHRLAWITAGLLLLYPLTLIVTELAGWWLRRHESELTDLDRRYQRTRMIRRLLLATTWIALIVIGTIGSLHGYWWNQPQRLTLFCVAIGLLAISAATLSSLIKQAAKDYSITMMRQMRREQLEMRADLDELCRRMRQVTMTSD